MNRFIVIAKDSVRNDKCKLLFVLGYYDNIKGTYLTLNKPFKSDNGDKLDIRPIVCLLEDTAFPVDELMLIDVDTMEIGEGVFKGGYYSLNTTPYFVRFAVRNFVISSFSYVDDIILPIEFDLDKLHQICSWFQTWATHTDFEVVEQLQYRFKMMSRTVTSTAHRKLMLEVQKISKDINTLPSDRWKVLLPVVTKDTGVVTCSPKTSDDVVDFDEDNEIEDVVDAVPVGIKAQLVDNISRYMLPKFESRYSEKDKTFMKKLPLMYTKLFTELGVASEKYKSFMEEVGSKLEPFEDRDYLGIFATNLTNDWEFGGKEFVKDVVGSLLPELSFKVGSHDVLTYLRELDAFYLKSIAMGDVESLIAGVHKTDLSDSVKDRLESFIAFMVECGLLKLWLCGIAYTIRSYARGKFTRVAECGVVNKAKVIPVMAFHQPYILFTLDNGFNLSDLDMLALLSNAITDLDKEDLRVRFAFAMNAKINEGDNTSYTVESLFELNNTYRKAKVFGEYIDDERLNLVYGRLDRFVQFYGLTTTVEDMEKGKLRINSLQNSLSENVLTGVKLARSVAGDKGILINVTNDSFCNLRDTDRELFVYFTLRKMADKVVNLDSKFNLNEAVRDFEALKDTELGLPKGTFKLNEKQKLAGGLVKHGIAGVTGPAGSGKTTTAEFMLYCLKAARGINDNEIAFVAPTGKAAARMSEVVKQPAKTLHSFFKIFDVSDFTVLRTDVLDNLKVLLVDETSMVNLDLMFNVLMRIKDTDIQVFLLGDRAQLAPIGKGRPFVDALKYIPCVTLDIVMRSGATAGTTLNCATILKTEADRPFYDMLGTLRQDSNKLREFDDFKMCQAMATDISEVIRQIVAYHLHGKTTSMKVMEGVKLQPDDIQIVTPLRAAKNNGAYFGSDVLNGVLHDVFNPYTGGDDIFFTDNMESLSLRIGDRVIHLENTYSACRVKEFDLKHGSLRGTLSDIDGGVANGEQGKYRGYIVKEALRLKLMDGLTSGSDFFKRHDNPMDLIDSDSITGFLVVEYPDFEKLMGTDSYLILYPVSVAQGMIGSCLTSRVPLDLAYASTIHKMQGSQAKMIIYAIEFAPNNSRNMLYTGISRAQKYVYLVGEVLKPNMSVDGSKQRKVSALDISRTYDDVMSRNTIVSEWLLK